MTDANRNTHFRFCFAYFRPIFSCPILIFTTLFVFGLGTLSFAQKTTQEQQLFQQLNESRQTAGLPPLQWDEHLAQAARDHTRRMIDANKLAHVVGGEPQVGERLAATGIRFSRSGENVGYNTDFDDIQRAWMDSPGHRENILNPHYNAVGIAVAKDDHGVYYATQDFAHALPERSNLEAERLAADALDKLRKVAKRMPWKRVQAGSLQPLACTMARSGKLNPRSVSGLPYVREAVVYNNSRPDELPESARRMALRTDITGYSVGACFTGDQPRNPGGTFYVVLAFY